MNASTAEQMSAWGAVVGGGATAIAAVAGVCAATAAIRTLRSSKRDSRDRSRPMVGALLAREEHPSSKILYLIVRSFGQSVAYDVRVTFDPQIEDSGTASGQGSFVPMLLNRYAKPIANMMPGVELRTLWFAHGASENGVIKNDEPIPDVVVANIAYRDRPAGDKQGNEYIDTFVLDVSVMRGETRATHSDDLLGLQKRSTKAFEKVAPALSQIATDLQRIESYIKPEEVRERDNAEAKRSRRQIDAMKDQLGISPEPEPS